MRSRLNLLGVVSITAVITYFSIRPLPVAGTPSGFSLGLLRHAVAYFALSAALLLYFHDTRYSHFEAIAVASTVGLGLELFQLTLGTRFFSLLDAAANTLGASVILLDHRSTVASFTVSFQDWLIAALDRKSF